MSIFILQRRYTHVAMGNQNTYVFLLAQGIRIILLINNQHCYHVVERIIHVEKAEPALY